MKYTKIKADIPCFLNYTKEFIDRNYGVQFYLLPSKITRPYELKTRDYKPTLKSCKESCLSELETKMEFLSQTTVSGQYKNQSLNNVYKCIRYLFQFLNQRMHI